MVVLANVTRLNSGEYKCESTDMENFNEVTGSTSVFVNCKHSAVT